MLFSITVPLESQGFQNSTRWSNGLDKPSGFCLDIEEKLHFYFFFVLEICWDRLFTKALSVAVGTGDKELSLLENDFRLLGSSRTDQSRMTYVVSMTGPGQR